MPDYGDPGWFQSFELGHQGYSEFLVYWDHDDDTNKVDQFYLDTSKMNIKNRFYTSLLVPISLSISQDRNMALTTMSFCSR